MQVQHSQMKKALLDVQKALIDAGCPKKLKSHEDNSVPFFYSCGGSYERQGHVPWSVAEKRALTPAEGVEWLAMRNMRRRG